MPDYVVLRTVADDGSSLIHLPTADRIVSRHADYLPALDAAKALRRADWHHRRTGELRTYSALETDGCAWRDDQTVWDYVSRSELWSTRGYALAVEASALEHYEPRP